ncbi:hypothetical protein K432DRAFT_386621 [Lepidopterella palustris CBS 459.81]|uniref:Uncharacterized protein n=1 Tax=Lepidopterella palustris CBS 459.81 TaxID=1314670 RepID=A0A8E2E080_9PEZI|nr:hypothetical protein K432DRAFT_386621 [Lepidopterella palustris CBS 459.81]
MPLPNPRHIRCTRSCPHSFHTPIPPSQLNLIPIHAPKNPNAPEIIPTPISSAIPPPSLLPNETIPVPDIPTPFPTPPQSGPKNLQQRHHNPIVQRQNTWSKNRIALRLNIHSPPKDTRREQGAGWTTGFRHQHHSHVRLRRMQNH